MLCFFNLVAEIINAYVPELEQKQIHKSTFPGLDEDLANLQFVQFLC